jgi:hypothetical protein
MTSTFKIKIKIVESKQNSQEQYCQHHCRMCKPALQIFLFPNISIITFVLNQGLFIMTVSYDQVKTETYRKVSASKIKIVRNHESQTYNSNRYKGNYK